MMHGHMKLKFTRRTLLYGVSYYSPDGFDILIVLSVFVGDFVQVTAYPKAQAYARIWFRV